MRWVWRYVYYWVGEAASSACTCGKCLPTVATSGKEGTTHLSHSQSHTQSRPKEDIAVTLRSIKLQSLEILSAPAAGDDADESSIDYAYSYKRRIDEKGTRVKTEVPVVRSVERAAFRRGEGRKWLLVDSVPVAGGMSGGAAAGCSS